MNKNKSRSGQQTLISINTRTFLQVTALLFALLIAAVVLTYLIPRGSFGTLPDGSADYMTYISRPDLGGIPILRGLLAPILVFFSSDGLTLIMLSLFLFIISASFQVMNDVGGIRVLIRAVSDRFRNRRQLLLILISFLFYSFGAFLGLFEEMLTMLPIVCALCVMLGYDSFTGFLCCIVSCGFGFAGAITNPFTVLLASEIIGVNPMEHIWMRLLVFAVMFLLLMLFLFRYVRNLKRNPDSSLTKEKDAQLRAEESENIPDGSESGSRQLLIYSVFLLVALVLIVISSLSAVLRSYTVVLLIVYFLVFGILAGILASGHPGAVLRSFVKGFAGALPTLVFIAFAASIKFVFDEGAIMPTIVSRINHFADGTNPFVLAATLYLIVLLLEFFISSSTAKAILVMGLLSVVHIGLSKPLMVLIYTFADGYTNVIFPTSPVLLISLSMIQVDYFSWVKKSLPLFFFNFVLVLLFLMLAIVVHY